MTDPREAKLPKWAQEALEAERVRAALCWPSEPEPEPDFEFDVNGFCAGEYPATGAELWLLSGTDSIIGVTMGEGGRSLAYKSAILGSRPIGRFFARRSDAILALRWRRSREAARRLRGLDIAIAEDRREGK